MSQHDTHSLAPAMPLPAGSCGSGLTVCVLVGLVAIASAGVAVQVSRFSAGKLEQRLIAVDRAWADAAEQIQTVKEMRLEQQSVARHAEITDSILEKAPRSNVLAAISAALPTGCWLERVQLDPFRSDPPPADDATDADGSTPPGDTACLQLTGMAQSDQQVARFVGQINASPLLRNAKLVSTENFPAGTRIFRRFRLELTLGSVDQKNVPNAQSGMTADLSR